MKRIHIVSIVATLVIAGFVMSRSTTAIKSGGGVDLAACVQPPSGLVSWYRAEGNFADSQDGNGGTPSGGVGFAPGKVGQAFNLDGVDDIISFGNPTNLQTTAVTAEAWIRPDTTFGNFRTVVSKWSQSANASWGLFVIRSQNSSINLIYGIVLNANGQVADAQGGNIPTGTAAPFTHVAMTYSAADGIKVYQDGVMVDSDVSVGPIRNGSDIVRIGNDRDNLATRHFDGLIDEVDIFNRALSAAEIQSIFNADSDGKCAGPPPSPTPTPCTYSITPARATFDSDADEGKVKVDAPVGCAWTLTTTVDSFSMGPKWLDSTVTSGSGTQDNIPYTVAENEGQNQRTGKVNVLGAFVLGQPLMVASLEVTQQADDACPMGFIRCLADPTNCTDAPNGLTQYRGFRDNLLGKTERGKKYTQDYYQHAGEITKLLIFNPGIFFRSKDVVERYQPILESVMKRERAYGRTQNPAEIEPTIVYEAELADVDELLGLLSEKASSQLRQTLEGLRRDIRDPQVQAEFGVRIRPGEKRPLPAEGQSTLKLIGKVSIFDFQTGCNFSIRFRQVAENRPVGRVRADYL